MRRLNPSSGAWFIPPSFLVAIAAALLAVYSWRPFGLIVIAAVVILSFVNFELCLLIFIALLPFDLQREVFPNLPIYLDLARVLLIPGFIFQVLRGGFPRVPRWAYLFWAYALVCLLSGYLHIIDPVAFGKESFRLILDLSFAWMVAASLNSTDKIIRVLKVLLAVSVPVSIYAIYQVAINDFGTLWYWMNPRIAELVPWTGRAPSFLAHPNHLGLYVNALIPFGFAFVIFSPRSRWRRFSALVTGLLLGSLFLTFSRGAWISFAMMAALWIMSRRRMAHTIAVLLSGALISIFLVTYLEEAKWLTRVRAGGIDPETIQGRIILMKTAATMFAEHPLLGIGYSDYAQMLKDYVNWNGMPVPCHNLYLQLLSETGILGFGFFMIPTLYLLVNCLRRYRLARNTDPKLKIVLVGCCGAIISVLVLGFVDVPVQVYTSPAFNELYWFIVGLTFVLTGTPSATQLKQPNPVPRHVGWAERPLAVAKSD